MILRFTLLTMLALLVSAHLFTQDCNTLDLAFSDVVLPASVDMGGTANRSGVAYNPVFQLYYSVNAGASDYPIDAYAESGVLLANPIQDFDYRGLWYNSLAGTIEGNGFGSNGIAIQALNVNDGHPTGSASAILPVNQPNSQSAGDFDPSTNQIVYYDNGVIFRYNRADNSFVDSFSIQGLPVALADVNFNTLVYVGCPNKEYGIYDYVNRRLMYVNKTTGQYGGFTQLPVSAPERNGFGMSYARNRFFLFDAASLEWRAYFVTDDVTDNEEQALLEAELTVGPNPTRGETQLTVSGLAANEQLEAQLFDFLGRPLLNRTFINTLNLSLTDIPAGTYFIRVKSLESGLVTAVQPLVKQ